MDYGMKKQQILNDMSLQIAILKHDYESGCLEQTYCGCWQRTADIIAQIELDRKNLYLDNLTKLPPSIRQALKV